MIYIIQFQEKPRAKWMTMKPADGIRGQILAFDNRIMALEKVGRLESYIKKGPFRFRVKATRA